MTHREKIKYIHEGKYMAEVVVDLIIHENEWSPYLSLEDSYKLDDVREALRRGDLRTAAKNATIYELYPIVIGSEIALPNAPADARSSRR